jgi:hypothetical protein
MFNSRRQEEKQFRKLEQRYARLCAAVAAESELRGTPSKVELARRYRQLLGVRAA